MCHVYKLNDIKLDWLYIDVFYGNPLKDSFILFVYLYKTPREDINFFVKNKMHIFFSVLLINGNKSYFMFQKQFSLYTLIELFIIFV